MDLQWNIINTDVGVPLHIYSMPHASSVACGVLVKAGTRDEHWPEEAGLAHAIEHMFFQGVRYFPDQYALSSYIEDVGGDINAWTNSERTFFNVHLPAEEIERGIYILSQQMRHPLFPEKKIKSEMQNIIQEIRRNRDNPGRHIIDLVRQKLYGSHPLGQSTGGLEKSVSKFRRTDFVRFHSRYYKDENFVFIAAGKFPEDSELKIAQLFSKYFDGLNHGAVNYRETKIDTPSRSVFWHEGRDIKQIHIALAAPTCRGGSREADILSLFEEMISGGMSFPLFREVRDRLGLCYSVWAHMLRWDDLSAFLIYVGTDPKKYKQALGAIYKVIEESKTDDRLLERAKKLILGKLSLSFESPDDVLEWAAKDISILGIARGPKEIAQIIERIGIDEIERVVNRYMRSSEFTRVFLTPKNVSVPETIQ